MIGGRVCKIVKRFACNRDDMPLANFEPVRGFNAKWKLLRRPAEHCLSNFTPLHRNGRRSGAASGQAPSGSLAREVIEKRYSERDQ
jgi:hypothetical protein